MKPNSISVEPGQIIHTWDNRVFRVKGKTASAQGEQYRLSNIAGTEKRVMSSAELAAVGVMSPRMIRVVGHLRAIIAFANDWDQHIRAIIEQAGFPVDPSINWNSWFQKNFTSRLLGEGSVTYDEGHIEDAIDRLIMVELLERQTLSKFDPAKVPPDVQKRPLEKQITWFIQQSLGYRLGDVIKYINKQLGWKKDKDEEAPSQQNIQLFLDSGEEGGGTEFNILDTEEHARPDQTVGELEEEETLKVIKQQFREYVAETLGVHGQKTPRSEKIADAMAKIFGYIADHSTSGQKGEFKDIFKTETGLGPDRLKQLYTEFGKLMKSFAAQYPEGSPAGDFINQIRNFESPRETEIRKKYKDKYRSGAGVTSSLLSAMNLAKSADYYHSNTGTPPPTAPGQLTPEQQEEAMAMSTQPSQTPPPQNAQPPQAEGMRPGMNPTPGQPPPKPVPTTVPAELPNQALHIRRSNKENTMATATAVKTPTRQELLKKIQARKNARAAASKTPNKLALIAANEPQEMGRAITELANFFGSMRASLLNMREHLDLLPPPKMASLKEKTAYRAKFAAGLKKLAEEEGGPQEFGSALSEVYTLLDEAAGAIENLAENSGVQLQTEPLVEEEVAVEEPLPMLEEESVGEPVAEEPIEEEVKEASGSDAFIDPQDEVEKKFGSRLTQPPSRKK